MQLPGFVASLDYRTFLGGFGTWGERMADKVVKSVPTGEKMRLNTLRGAGRSTSFPVVSDGLDELAMPVSFAFKLPTSRN